MKKIVLYTFMTVMAASWGCQMGLDDPKPSTSVLADEAITDINSLESATVGCYSNLQSANYYGNYYTTWPDLATNNTDHTGTFTDNREVNSNRIFSPNIGISNMWSTIYSGINRANTVIWAADSLSKITENPIAEGDRDYYKGEGLFLRGMHYFNLARFFTKLPYDNGDVLGLPLMLTPTRTVADASKLITRSSVSVIYDQIIADLTEAEQLLPPFQVGRASGIASAALLARVYLYRGDYQNALAKATEVLNAVGQTEELITPYANIFANKNTDESILELQFDINNQNNLAFWYFPSALGGRREFAPSADLVQAYDTNDLRLPVTIDVFNGAYFGTKFSKVGSLDDNIPLIRVAEMFLSIAEAQNELGNLAEAAKHINVVRSRAGLEAIVATDQAAMRLAIEKERRLEFALEGHYWFDLRRTGRVGEVLGEPLLSEPWRGTFPIPQSDMDRNPSLIQNPGY